MNAISNQKGAYQKFIRCHFSQDGQQKVTLKDVFIKKSENYILHVGNFHTNATIPLFMEDEQKEASISIEQKDTQNSQFPRPYHVNNRLSLYSDFHAGVTQKDASIAAFLDRMRDFIDRFNYKLNMYGSVDLGQGQNVDPVDPGQDLQGLPLPPFAGVQHDPHTYVDTDDVVEYIRLGLTEDGRLVIKLNRIFLSNFYITFGEKFRTYFGLPKYIWASTNAAGTALITSVQAGIDDQDIYVLNPGPLFQHPANAFNGPPIRFTSVKSAFQADTRISLDIEATLPLYNTMTSEFSEEKQEFLLTRFPIPEYLDVQSSNQTSNNLVITGVDFQDGLMSGVKDLVRDPHTHVIGLRSGRIQALNITLWVRYMMDGAIKKTFLVLGPDEWVDLTLVFTKKV